MKFLHLADLHIGKSLNGFSMLDEQRRAFSQINEYIRTQRPDAAVIAGDIYDRAAPGAEAVSLLDDLLTDLARAGIAVLLISGNHDSPERLNYASRLLAGQRLHLCGSYRGSLERVALADGQGEVNFWLLPFIKPSAWRGPLGEGDSYDAALAAALGGAAIDYGARNVLVSHQFFIRAGTAPLLSDSELNPVGGLGAADASLIEKFDYAALGHLHRAQSLGAEHIRYAGSPVKYSFSEWRRQKSVSLVELKEKGDLTITELPLVPLHDLREIRGELRDLISGEAAAPGKKDDYLRVILTDEEEIINPLDKLRRVYPNVMSLEFDNSRSGTDISGGLFSGAPLERSLSVHELFSEFFLDRQGSTMNEEQAEIIKKILEAEDEAP